MKLISLILLCLLTNMAEASMSSKYLLGLGYFSQNSLYHSTSVDSGKTSLLGASVLYPLVFTYSTSIFSDWNFNPQFQWTALPRNTDAYSSSFMLLAATVGKNWSNNWQWYTGPGLFLNTLKGKGGSKVLNNGTSTSTFALPERSVTTTTVIMDLGLAWEGSSQRVALGSLLEDLLSMTGKRAYHVYLNWSYAFNGGF